MAESSPAQSGNIFAWYFSGLKLLRQTRSEFWTMQVISLLDGIGYFAIVGIAVVILETDVGFTAERAAMTWTAIASAASLSFLFVGPITDWLGIRRSMLISMGGLLILRALAAVFALAVALPFRGQVVIAALVLMADTLRAEADAQLEIGTATLAAKMIYVDDWRWTSGTGDVSYDATDNGPHGQHRRPGNTVQGIGQHQIFLPDQTRGQRGLPRLKQGR